MPTSPTLRNINIDIAWWNFENPSECVYWATSGDYFYILPSSPFFLNTFWNIFFVYMFSKCLLWIYVLRMWCHLELKNNLPWQPYVYIDSFFAQNFTNAPRSLRSTATIFKLSKIILKKVFIQTPQFLYSTFYIVRFKLHNFKCEIWDNLFYRKKICRRLQSKSTNFYNKYN